MDRRQPFAEDVFNVEALFIVNLYVLLERFITGYEDHYVSCAPGIRYGCRHTRFVQRLLPARVGHTFAREYAVRAVIQDLRGTEAIFRVNPVTRRQNRPTRFRRYIRHTRCNFANWRLCGHSNGDCFLPFRRPAEALIDFCIRCEAVEIAENVCYLEWDLMIQGPPHAPPAAAEDASSSDDDGDDDAVPDLVDAAVPAGAAAAAPAPLDVPRPPREPVVVAPADPLIDLGAGIAANLPDVDADGNYNEVDADDHVPIDFEWL